MSFASDYVNVTDLGLASNRVKGKMIISASSLVADLQGINSKNEVIDVFLKYASECFCNVVVFTAFSHSIQLLKGCGANLRTPSYLGSINVDKNTIIRRVIVNKFPYRGSIPVGYDEKTIFMRFFKTFAEEVYLYPGAIGRENTDILFYADGYKDTRSSSILTFEYIVEKTILALRYLWVKKRLFTI